MKVFAFLAVCLGLAAAQSVDVFNENDLYPHHDCHSLFEAGYSKNGTYRLTLNGTHYLLPCEFNAEQGFTIFLYRVDDVITWDRSYSAYQYGFGNPLYDYFSGLEVLHYLTTHVAKGSLSLYTRFMDWKDSAHSSLNEHFFVDSVHTGYKLHVWGSYSGDVKNEMYYNSGYQFYTIDHRDPRGCVDQMRGGWWYNYCSRTLPTGKYYKGGHYHMAHHFGDGIFWQDYIGVDYSLKRFSMAVTRSSFFPKK